jgi:hypothetical protein
MPVTRDMIEELIRKINKAENIRPTCTVEETISAIDAVCAPDFEGRFNAGSFHNREAERQGERMLFSRLPDYHRTIERRIIDPPFAAFEWTITGTQNGVPVKVKGCSIVECNNVGMLRRGMVFLDTAQLPSSGG